MNRPLAVVALLCSALALAQGAPHGSGASGITIATGVGSSPSASGMSLSGGTLTLQPADSTHPGIVTLADQTMGAGKKTFQDTVTITGQLKVQSNFESTAAGGANFFGDSTTNRTSFFGSKADSSSAVGSYIGVGGAYVSAGAKVVGFAQNCASGTPTLVSGVDINGAYIHSSGAGIYFGTGSPASAVTAVVGSIYLRTDGGASTTLYVKESGTGNTGWVAK